MPSGDKDLDLKLRMRRLFWRMNFYCPTEIIVSAWEYPGRRRYDVTDIDVVGIRFDKDLRQTVIIADCKGGEAGAGRLLWLRGAMDLMGASSGYFVKTSVHANTIALASKLSVGVLNEANLTKLETQIGVAKVPNEVGSMRVYIAQEKAWGAGIPKGRKPTTEQAELKKLYQYYDYYFWFIEPYRNVLSTTEKLSNVRAYLPGNEIDAKYTFYQIASLFAISLLQGARDVMTKDLSQIASFGRQYLFGGVLALRERERFFDLLAKYTGEDIALEPKYFDKLLELFNTVVTHSAEAADVPRYLESCGIQLLDRGYLEMERFWDVDFDVGTLKIAKDVCLFLIDSAGLDKLLVGELLVE